jgi:hypothetical protein
MSLRGRKEGSNRKTKAQNANEYKLHRSDINRATGNKKAVSERTK